jgi:hypothetical protein
MKIRRSTVALLIVAAAFGGVVTWYETRVVPQREAAEAKQKQLFGFSEDQVASVKITMSDRTLQLRRREKSDGESQWMLRVVDYPEGIEPLAENPKPASEGAVAFLLNLLATEKSDRSVPMGSPQKELESYGLREPLARLQIRLQNKEFHEMVLGGTDFSGQFLYAQVNPQKTPDNQKTVLLVPKSFQQAVEKPISQWQADGSAESNTTSGESPATPTPTPKD